MIYCTIE